MLPLMFPGVVMRTFETSIALLALMAFCAWPSLAKSASEIKAEEERAAAYERGKAEHAEKNAAAARYRAEEKTVERREEEASIDRKEAEKRIERTDELKEKEKEKALEGVR
jgi:biopolymer transport protein ExbB/TolQ